MSAEPVALVFGGTGAIGSAVAARFQRAGWRAVATSRNSSPGGGLQDARVLRVDPFAPDTGLAALAQHGPFEAVCWAQGMNINDSVERFDPEKHLELYKANCLFVMQTLNYLLAQSLLPNGARLCIVSSVWQKLARQNKLSYCVSKAALQGLVLSAAVDLAPRGMLVNAVLPGPIDTPMTRRALSTDQITKLEAASPVGRLATLDQVAEAVYGLCSRDNRGISGQFVEVDAGFSYARLV